MATKKAKGNGKERTRKLLQDLKERITKIKSSKEFKQLLKVMVTFHRYSVRNCMLIMMQSPNATLVAGFKKWIKLNRKVRKGEKAIWILAPRVGKKVEEKDGEEVESQFMFFVSVPVFDIGQTDGEPLPNPTALKIPNANGKLLAVMLKVAKKLKIKVEFKTIREDGQSHGGRVVINDKKNKTEQALILVHEIAHELIHWKDRKEGKGVTREQEELEAEAIAFLWGDYFGLPETGSGNYLALHQKSHDLLDSLNVIHNSFRTITDATEEVLEAEASKKTTTKKTAKSKAA